jgi:hypothetical protein
MHLAGAKTESEYCAMFFRQKRGNVIFWWRMYIVYGIFFFLFCLKNPALEWVSLYISGNLIFFVRSRNNKYMYCTLYLILTPIFSVHFFIS